MTDKDREYYMKKYRHINLYFCHGRGWDMLTLTAAILLDQQTWPRWMPLWLKHIWFKFRPDTIPSNFIQIKEKFGGLRLYSYGNQIELFQSLESLSYCTCETCGTTHNVGTTKGGWIFTTCEPCFDKMNEHRKFNLTWKENKI